MNHTFRHLFLVLALTAQLPLASAQTGPETAVLRACWDSCVQPLIDADMEALREVVHFPLGGEWGFMMGLTGPSAHWRSEDFYAHFDLLFDASLRQQLHQLSYADAALYEWEDEPPQIHLNCSRSSQSGFEKSLILRFGKISGKWKLIAIQAAG